jgi:hypothetical protein
MVRSTVDPFNILVDFLNDSLYSVLYNGLKVDVLYMANPMWGTPNMQDYVLSLK